MPCATDLVPVNESSHTCRGRAKKKNPTPYICYVGVNDCIAASNKYLY